jgi:PucR C-terminal helix-turn-helix domain
MYSADEGDVRGAAHAAPRSTTPLTLVEASIAGLEALVAEAQRLADNLSEAELPSGAATSLLAELRDAGLEVDSGEEDTYRLLAGVLIHSPTELRALRERTIAPLELYDADHDTRLVETLESFLAHHGSTTDTAEAMGLHRHTVGYRLTRIQEVSGLSPYESEGRERLSLGLKAKRILLADQRRAATLDRAGEPDSARGWRAGEPLQRGGGPARPTAPGTASD